MSAAKDAALITVSVPTTSPVVTVGIISGIGRYTRRQRALAEKLGRLAGEIKDLPADEKDKREELEQQRLWDTRIYEERQRSLTYICEQPVLLEQRAFALARLMMAQLD